MTWEQAEEDAEPLLRRAAVVRDDRGHGPAEPLLVADYLRVSQQGADFLEAEIEILQP